MQSKIINLLESNIGKILSLLIFAFMGCGVMLPMHAFATSESISGSLTLELVSSGGGGDVPGGGDSAVIDASTSSPTGAFNFLPIILGIFAVGLIVLLVYLYKTGKLKNKTLSIFALCLVVSVGFCGAKSIIANAADANDLKADNISSSAYLKFDETGKVLENKLDIENSSEETINIENITSDSEYASIFPDLKGTKIVGNSSYEGKLNCDSVPQDLIEQVKESQGKVQIEGVFKVQFNKEKALPSDVKVSINMPSEDGVFVGDELNVNLENFPSDASAGIKWYKVDKDGNKSLVGEQDKYTVAEDLAGSYIVAEVEDTSGKYTTSVSSEKVAVYKDRLPDDASVEITLPQEEKEIVAGDKLGVELKKFPSDATAKVEWYRVDKEGKETLASEGKEYTVLEDDIGYNLTVKVTDSSELYTGSIKCDKQIYVHKQYPSDTKVAVKLPEAGKAIVAGDVLNIELTKFPKDANAKYAWYRVDSQGTETPVGDEESYTVTSDDEGYEIKVKVSDSNGIYASSLVSDNVKVYKTFPDSMTVKINDSDANLSVNVGDTLTCNIANPPTGITTKIKWYKIDSGKTTEVSSDDTYTVKEEDEGSVIFAKAFDESGLYSGKESQNKAQVIEAYGYLDTSTEGVENLILTYDTEKSSRGSNVYKIRPDATEKGSWGWDSIRGDITKVTITGSFKNYSRLKSTSYMFYDFQNVTSHDGFENINTANVENMAYMFYGYGYQVENFNIVPNVTKWTTSKVTNMAGMFGGYGWKSKTLESIPNMSEWTTTSLTNINGMFASYGGSERSFECLDLSKFDTTNITKSEDYSLALGGIRLKSIKISPSFKISLGLLSLTNSSGSTTASWYDKYNKEYATSDLPVGSKVSDVTTYYDTTHAIAYGYMDYTSESGQKILVFNFDTENQSHTPTYYLPTYVSGSSSWPWITRKTELTKIKINDDFKNYKGLTNTNGMFQDFSNLTSITGLQNLDISSVTNTSKMFYGCSRLSSADFSTDWNVLSADNMSSMFAQCSSLTLDCKDWQVKTECNHTDFNKGADNVQLPQAWRTTQNESGSLASSEANENNSMSDNAINNQGATKDKNSTDALTPDTQQDKSSSTDADTKDKATDKAADKTDTQQADTKAEEAEPVLSVLLNFTSSVTSFFNSLRLPFV